MVTNRRGRYTTKEKEVKTKEKSLKQTYREAWKAFTAYRRKTNEEIKLKKELKRAKDKAEEEEVKSKKMEKDG